MKAIVWLGDRARILDQTRLPGELVYLDLYSYEDMAQAIREMKIRGAPAIGIAAGYGMALAALNSGATTRGELLAYLEQASKVLQKTRPTAQNLFQALERMENKTKGQNIGQIKSALLAEAQSLHAEETEAEKLLSNYGADLIQDGFAILTHCNAGALATGGYGTALGVIKAAKEQGKKVTVYATETRPLMQGARLTCSELVAEQIPVTLVVDSAAGYLLSQGKIDCAVVGADRIAANGDVANKIGTYSVAVLCAENGVPFYVAAPTSTLDLSLPTGKDIPIEERGENEVTHLQGVRLAPEGIRAMNPAFDITPHHYITAIITEKGITREPFQERLAHV